MEENHLLKPEIQNKEIIKVRLDTSICKIINNKPVISMSTMFSEMTNVTIIDISSFDTSKVIDMSYMFSEDSNLETILMGSDWDISNVVQSAHMFEKSPKLPNFDPNYINKTKAYAGHSGYLTL